MRERATLRIRPGPTTTLLRNILRTKAVCSIHTFHWYKGRTHTYRYTRTTCECYIRYPTIPAAAVTSHSHTHWRMTKYSYVYGRVKLAKSFVPFFVHVRVYHQRLCVRRIIVLYDSFITRRYTRASPLYRHTGRIFLSRRTQRTLRARRRSIGAPRIFAMSILTFPHVAGTVSFIVL